MYIFNVKRNLLYPCTKKLCESVLIYCLDEQISNEIKNKYIFAFENKKNE